MGIDSKAIAFFQIYILILQKWQSFFRGLKTTFTLKKNYFSPCKIFDIKKLKSKTHIHISFTHFVAFWTKTLRVNSTNFVDILKKSENFNMI
jgi:hypothetical protein